MPSRSVAAAVLAALVAWPAPGARAGTPDPLVAPAPPGAAALDRAALERDDAHTRLWFWGWMTVYLGWGAFKGVMAARASGGDRREAGVEAACSGLGAVGLLIGGVGPGVDLPPPDASAVDVHRALVRQADAEAEARRGWFGHVANALVGVGTSLYFWQGLHRPGAALLNLPLSIGTGELQIWTTPAASLERVEGP